MKYKRKEIDRAGFALIGDDPFKRQQALEVVTDWRQLHLPVLRELNDELTEYFEANGIQFEFSSHRIKRMQSIVEKLKNKEKMGLGGVHDIGGVRFVFDGLEELGLAEAALLSFQPKNFVRKDKVRDYIEEPKPDGYRSIHYVYKYESDNPDYDGLQIELQIRTKLQHSWAMAVETASLITGTSLKASIQDGSIWREFFKLLSAVISKKEGKPVLEEYASYTDDQICGEYFMYADKHKLVDTLKALRVAAGFDQHKRTGDCYCLLIVNFVTRRVGFRYFDTAEDAQASDYFTKMEQTITSDEAALMVSMEKIEEMQKAYPSYFLDTGKFIEVLEDFEQFCELNYPRR